MGKLEDKYKEDRNVIPGKNDLLTWCKEHMEIGKDIISEWDPENGSMEDYKPGSGKMVKFNCTKCGQPYFKAIKHRVNGNIHEPCGRKIGIERLKQYHKDKMQYEKSLQCVYPELLDEWDYESNSAEGIEPDYISYKSSRKVHWICKECGNHYYTYVRSRTLNGIGCQACRKKRLQEQKEKMSV